MKNPELIEAAQDVLTQGLDLLFAIDEKAYQETMEAPFNAALGQHYRHVLDHFSCLLAGLASSEINYDARTRERRLETDIHHARVFTCDLLRALKSMGDADLARNCKVVYSVAYNSAEAACLQSNVARELAFCVGHAIHHYAIIRFLCNRLGVEVPVAFGVAPATMKHRAAVAAN